MSDREIAARLRLAARAARAAERELLRVQAEAFESSMSHAAIARELGESNECVRMRRRRHRARQEATS